MFRRSGLCNHPQHREGTGHGNHAPVRPYRRRGPRHRSGAPRRRARPGRAERRLRRAQRPGRPRAVARTATGAGGGRAVRRRSSSSTTPASRSRNARRSITSPTRIAFPTAAATSPAKAGTPTIPTTRGRPRPRCCMPSPAGPRRRHAVRQHGRRLVGARPAHAGADRRPDGHPRLPKQPQRAKTDGAVGRQQGARAQRGSPSRRADPSGERPQVDLHQPDPHRRHFGHGPQGGPAAARRAASAMPRPSASSIAIAGSPATW